ncbi:ankyrin repeat domain-containing protein [Pseudomonas putida]|uniref:ankyrin repeat domain-containing protein n=1 Tax=Pseudomonas putida TaxID=303 RepID=UPI003D339FB7
MATEDEKKQAQLKRSLLDAYQKLSLRSSYGYGVRTEGDYEKFMQSYLNKREDMPDDEDNPEAAASEKYLAEQLFINNAKIGNFWSVGLHIKSGTDVNAQDRFGMTALHYAAATGFRPCIRLLVNSGKCNYLIKDNKGRLASDLAYEWGRDYAVGLLLQKKEARQAYQEGRS